MTASNKRERELDLKPVEEETEECEKKVEMETIERKKLKAKRRLKMRWKETEKCYMLQTALLLIRNLN